MKDAFIIKAWWGARNINAMQFAEHLFGFLNRVLTHFPALGPLYVFNTNGIATSISESQCEFIQVLLRAFDDDAWYVDTSGAFSTAVSPESRCATGFSVLIGNQIGQRDRLVEIHVLDGQHKRQLPDGHHFEPNVPNSIIMRLSGYLNDIARLDDFSLILEDVIFEWHPLLASVSTHDFDSFSASLEFPIGLVTYVEGLSDSIYLPKGIRIQHLHRGMMIKLADNMRPDSMQRAQTWASYICDTPLNQAFRWRRGVP